MSTRAVIAELSQRIRRMERLGGRSTSERDRGCSEVRTLPGLNLPGSSPHERSSREPALWEAASHAAASHAAGARDPGLLELFCKSTWPRGCLVEWLAEGRGSGAASLGLWATRGAWQQRLLVMIESRREWYAPAAVPLAVNLQKTVFIRPERPGDALWSLEQVLRTRGVGAVMCDVEGLSPQACRRLQLAAETGGGVGVLLRPARARGQPSFAEYRFLVQPLPRRERTVAAGVVRRWRVELLRSRRPLCGTSVVVELRHGPHGMCLVAELESAASGA